MCQNNIKKLTGEKPKMTLANVDAIFLVDLERCLPSLPHKDIFLKYYKTTTIHKVRDQRFTINYDNY